MTNPVSTEPVLDQIRGFKWTAVPVAQDSAARRQAAEDPPPPLGAISSFSGKFRGSGFNTIFRPQNAATPTLTGAEGPADNILELNLTEELLSFSPALGKIPNRGFSQGDIDLNGIPYVQTINDVNDPDTPLSIHFEPGVWLAVPATEVPAVDAVSFVRMASIPHGTTIEAQGTAFPSPSGRPQIATVSITPFPIGGDQKTQGIEFPSQTAANANTFRLPQDLKAFIDTGRITQELLTDPTFAMRQRAEQQDITATTVIVIDTNPNAPLFGGGTDNIAFLLGDATDASKANANAAQMGAIFWVEVIRETITVPALDPGQPVIVDGDASHGDPVATFSVTSAEGTSAPTEKEVVYTQIQYTQQVLLNFNGLSWPHVSVATLVPNDPIPVTLP
ncbi:heme-binding protein [Actinomycetospora sp. C-140]